MFFHFLGSILRGKKQEQKKKTITKTKKFLILQTRKYKLQSVFSYNVTFEIIARHLTSLCNKRKQAVGIMVVYLTYSHSKTEPPYHQIHGI